MGDVLVALLILAVAVVLGLTVHPILFLLILVAVVFLIVRGAMRSGSRL